MIFNTRNSSHLLFIIRIFWVWMEDPTVYDEKLG